jgi:hypothetical protein
MYVHDLYLCYFMPPCNGFIHKPGMKSIHCEYIDGKLAFDFGRFSSIWGTDEYWVVVPLNNP